MNVEWWLVVRLKIHGKKQCSLFLYSHVLPFNPCFRQLSRTTKNCCSGGYSESKVLPRLREDWINTLILSFIMLRRLDLSIDMGLLVGKAENDTVRRVKKKNFFLRAL